MGNDVRLCRCKNRDNRLETSANFRIALNDYDNKLIALDEKIQRAQVHMEHAYENPLGSEERRKGDRPIHTTYDSSEESSEESKLYVSSRNYINNRPDLVRKINFDMLNVQLPKDTYSKLRSRSTQGTRVSRAIRTRMAKAKLSGTRGLGEGCGELASGRYPKPHPSVLSTIPDSAEREEQLLENLYSMKPSNQSNCTNYLRSGSAALNSTQRTTLSWDPHPTEEDSTHCTHDSPLAQEIARKSPLSHNINLTLNNSSEMSDLLSQEVIQSILKQTHNYKGKAIDFNITFQVKFDEEKDQHLSQQKNNTYSYDNHYNLNLNSNNNKKCNMFKSSEKSNIEFVEEEVYINKSKVNCDFEHTTQGIK